jgi:hypothetical protein
MCAALCEKKTDKQKAVNFSVHQDGGPPSIWIPEVLGPDADSLNRQYHAITNKYTEVAFVVQVHEVLSDIEIFAGCASARVGETSERTIIVNSTENRAKFGKSLTRKLLLALIAACTR